MNCGMFNIGNQIRDLRKQKKITQKKLSELTGMSQAHLSLFEAGKRDISLKKMLKICKALNIKLEFSFVTP